MTLTAFSERVFDLICEEKKHAIRQIEKKKFGDKEELYGRLFCDIAEVVSCTVKDYLYCEKTIANYGSTSLGLLISVILNFEQDITISSKTIKRIDDLFDLYKYQLKDSYGFIYEI